MPSRCLADGRKKKSLALVIDKLISISIHERMVALLQASHGAQDSGDE